MIAGSTIAGVSAIGAAITSSTTSSFFFLPLRAFASLSAISSAFCTHRRLRGRGSCLECRALDIERPAGRATHAALPGRSLRRPTRRAARLDRGRQNLARRRHAG